MNNMINYLTKNKRRISKFLYLAAALIEQLPDVDATPSSRLLKTISGGTITLADQLQSKQNKRNGRNQKSK
jgi:hypothetical protein